MTAAIDKIQSRIQTAYDMMEEGFATKAAQKRAMEQLNRAYGEAQSLHHAHTISAFIKTGVDTDTDEGWQQYVDHLNHHELPFDLHNLRDRHIDVARELTPLLAEIMTEARELREAVKAAPIKPAQPKQCKIRQRVEMSIKELVDKRMGQFHEAVDLGRELGGLPVSCNVHGVMNQYGTFFVRRYFYLDGTLTPLSVIIAAAEKLADEAKA